MSEWPALERQLQRSAWRLYRRPWSFVRPRPLIAGALAAVALAFVMARASERPSDERAVPPPATSGPLARYGPVPAHVISRSPSSPRMEIDRGREDGVHRGDPVVAGVALIGRVRSVHAMSAAVMLITDPLFSVAARTGRERVFGIAEPYGSGGLQLGLTQRPKAVVMRDRVYTAGTPASRPDLRSAYPAGILIGTVSHVDTGTSTLDPVIRIAPAARLDKLTDVQVLTRPHER
jgi:rod shape-determining protein MreC